MKCLRYSKKGNAILDVALIVFLLAVTITFAVVLAKPLNMINDKIQNTTTYSNESKTFIQKETTNFPKYIDGIIGVALIVLWIISMLLGSYIDSSAGFFAISIILLIAVLIGAGMLGNATVGVLGSDLDSFPISQWVLNNILLIILAMFITIGASVYIGQRQ